MKTIVVSIMLIIVAGTHISSVQAFTPEDEANPISFIVKILPWEKANHIIPNKAIFTIIDVETGMHFKVQRRAGRKHADVQPLSYEDTKIMKKIYNGKWSWRRKAILIIINDQMLAASMHGMPHGAGALKNGFPGHFCVHFYGSTTHGSGIEDFSHKMMILQAGGKLEEYLNEIEPVQVVNVFETAVNQKDINTISLILADGQKAWQKKLQKNMFVSINKESVQFENENNPLIQRLSFDATIYKSGFNRERKKLNFLLYHDIITGQWKLDGDIANQL
nr:hypothetical protein [uncultured Bacillus sp.]